MNPKSSDTAMQCVNCGIYMKRLKRRWMAEESEELRQLLSDWTCKEHEDSDIICIECYNLLHLCLESEDKSRKFGHKHVCLTCGSSLFRAPSVCLSDRPEHKLLVAQWAPSHQVKRLENICRKCWLKAHRRMKQKNEIHSEQGGVGIKNEVHSESNGVRIKIEPLQSILGDGELDIPASSESEDEVIPDKHPQPPSICMATYKRAADSSARCMFKHCKQPNRSKLPRALIERLLIDYSFYIPTHSRACEQHRVNTHRVWSELVDNSKITDFTVAHLENLCSILKNTKYNAYCRNFESSIKQDEYLCKYWLGVNYKTYEEMLKDIQQIKKRVWCVKKALAMYLMKKHTGFSYEKVATFFGVRPKVLLKIIDVVHRHLQSKEDYDQSFVAIPTVNRDNRAEIVYYRV